VKTIAIVGGSGYVGSKLISALLRAGTFRVKVLSRSAGLGRKLNGLGRVELVEGDLLSPASLRGFLEPGCVVVNLVYLWDAGEDANLVCMRNLVAECKEAVISRLVHVSTAAVAGRVGASCVDEDTVSMPISEYGITKLKVEALLRGASEGGFDLVMLRPTSIFGPGAEPLSKLTRDLLSERWLMNYMKSSLFGRRRMNLVHIDNVTAAIIFVASRVRNFSSQVLIVSDDDASANNFRDVESALLRGFGLPAYLLPPINIPLDVLRTLLRLLGRNNINPRCNYSCQRIQSLGFRRPMNFEAGLAEYIADYRSKGASKVVPNECS
jgi:nucleoside-diphosphate-sugar epimerase